MAEPHRPLLSGLTALCRSGVALVAFVMAAGLGVAPQAVASPQHQGLEWAARLESLQRQIEDPASANLSASALIGQANLTGFAPAGPDEVAQVKAAPALPFSLTAFATVRQAEDDPFAGPVEVQRLNMRLALTMLSQAYGPEDTGAVLAAQSKSGANMAGPTLAPQDGAALDALVVRRGSLTLASLREVLVAQGMAEAGSGQALTLKVPLVLWAEARLELSPGDVLNLSRPDGAFIINFGHLDVQGATIAAVGDRASASLAFVPFVTTADSGSVTVSGGRISGLGFGSSPKFSGFSIMRNALRPSGRASTITDSRFDGVMTVAIAAADDVEVRGNHFRDMRGPALVLTRSRDAIVSGNLFSGRMPTNAIRFEEGSADGVVDGNVILGGERAGIVVRNGSAGVTLSQNIIFRRKGSGITVLKSDCGHIWGNLVLQNRQKGIEVRTSRGTDVQRNAVMGNHSAGLWVSAQPEGTETRMMANMLAANGSGISTAEGERLVLAGNDFRHQFPQFLSGDMAMQSFYVARNLRGDEPLVLTSGGLGDLAPVAAKLAASDVDVCAGE